MACHVLTGGMDPTTLAGLHRGCGGQVKGGKMGSSGGKRPTTRLKLGCLPPCICPWGPSPASLTEHAVLPGGLQKFVSQDWQLVAPETLE